MNQLTETAQRTSREHDMFSAHSPVLVMVSGGADSVSLLHLLASAALGPMPLRVLHVNHLLRGDEALADEQFVRDLGARLGVEVRVVRFDVAEYAKAEGLNLEDAGRRVRYRFAEEELDAWCVEIDTHRLLGRIAVAHTLDDRIETFFMRALYGAGAGGLASIAPVRGRIVRPLIETERGVLREWLTGLGEQWREDVTNADETRLRARVRAVLLPAAEKVNPAFRPALARTMDLLGDDDALLGSMADAFVRDFAEVHEEREVAFNREMMLTLDRTMARRTIRSALMAAFEDASRMTAEHVEMLVDGLAKDQFAHDLPGDLRAFGEYGRMVVCRSGVESKIVAPHLLPITGTTDLGEAGTITVEPADPLARTGTPESIVIDEDRISGELTVDAARPGDRMRPLGLQGSRKLSDLFIDAKVPQRVRSSHPVIRDGERIVWLAGVRMSDDYRLTPKTTRALRLTWNRTSL